MEVNWQFLRDLIKARVGSKGDPGPVLRRLCVAPLAFTSPVPGTKEGETYRWPDVPKRLWAYRFGTSFLPIPLPDFKTMGWSLLKLRLPDGKPPAPGNHAKVFMVDGKAYVVGSDNLYPHDLAEFSYLVEGPAVDEFKTSYWNEVWRYSGKLCVSDCCAAHEVLLFEDQNFGGKSQRLRLGYNAGPLAVGNDVVSSVKVSNGFKVTLYENVPGNGRAKVLTGDVTALPDFDNITSNVVVEPTMIDDETRILEVDFYLLANPDLASLFTGNSAGAIKHWLQYGISEGRTSATMFDVQYYLNQYPDLKKLMGTNFLAAAEHWLQFGIREGRRSADYFDVKYYVETNPDLKALFGTNYPAAINHWRKYGIVEGRRTSADFDVAYYVKANADVKALFGTDYRRAIAHWVRFGRNERRVAVGPSVSGPAPIKVT
ncbi:MAG: hypothetical protein ABL962_15115 [Fimbriimonadaceae bacterium]